MIHYNVWFDLRVETDETDSLDVIREFLTELHAAGSIAGFQLLRNSGGAAKTKMLRFQALMEFRDDAQFSKAFSEQAARGIHTGLHGRAMALVSAFQIEVFREIDFSSASSGPAISDL